MIRSDQRETEMARTRRNVGQAAPGEIQAITIDNPGPPGPISMTAIVGRDGETFEEAIARTLPVVDPTVPTSRRLTGSAAIDSVLLATPVRRQTVRCDHCHIPTSWTTRVPLRCRSCGHTLPITRAQIEASQKQPSPPVEVAVPATPQRQSMTCERCSTRHNWTTRRSEE